MVQIEEIFDESESPEGRKIDDSEGPTEASVSEPSSSENVERAEALKLQGNQAYGEQDYSRATELYSDALALVPGDSTESSVYHANRAACQLALSNFSEAIQDCTRALEVNGNYVKALMRRSSAYEKLDELEKALEDAKKVLELEEHPVAKKTVARLEPKVEERREKMKEEMIGKLKDMGNAVLGKFGMSLDNFNAQKDPETGSYSINFKQ
ncbi:hypothetical protein BSKO_00712 [Bryopsis sp. KO-2023]|nr:hypothetical protein BSKO_00712 [Bryopsis sp. KO-2023]